MEKVGSRQTKISTPGEFSDVRLLVFLLAPAKPPDICHSRMLKTSGKAHDLSGR